MRLHSTSPYNYHSQESFNFINEGNTGTSILHTDHIIYSYNYVLGFVVINRPGGQVTVMRFNNNNGGSFLTDYMLCEHTGPSFYNLQAFEAINDNEFYIVAYLSTNG